MIMLHPEPNGQTENGFQDPLEDYDYKVIDDPVERALAEQSVCAIQHEPITLIRPDTSVKDALQTLSGLEVACLLVGEGDRLEGIFSERDVLELCVDQFEDLMDRPVSEVMTKDPVYIYDTDCAAKALCVMAVSGYRHVPILDAEENIIGIVSPLRVTSFLQKNFTAPSKA